MLCSWDTGTRSHRWNSYSREGVLGNTYGGIRKLRSLGTDSLPSLPHHQFLCVSRKLKELPGSSVLGNSWHKSSQQNMSSRTILCFLMALLLKWERQAASSFHWDLSEDCTDSGQKKNTGAHHQSRVWAPVAGDVGWLPTSTRQCGMAVGHLLASGSLIC